MTSSSSTSPSSAGVSYAMSPASAVPYHWRTCTPRSASPFRSAAGNASAVTDALVKEDRSSPSSTAQSSNTLRNDGVPPYAVARNCAAATACASVGAVPPGITAHPSACAAVSIIEPAGVRWYEKLLCTTSPARNPAARSALDPRHGSTVCGSSSNTGPGDEKSFAAWGAAITDSPPNGGSAR